MLNRAVGRMRIFGKERDFEAFEEVIGEAKCRLPMRVLAWCVMPNHWHFVLWPRGDGDLSEFMRWLTVTHTQRWHAAHRTAGTGPLYQGRFKSFPIQEDDHLWTVLRYVERNPLRANLVEEADAWRWSSLWHRVRGNRAGLLDDGPLALPRRWRQHVQSPQTEAELEALRRSRGAWLSVWRGVLAAADGEAIGSAIDAPSPRPSVEITDRQSIKTPDPFMLPSIDEAMEKVFTIVSQRCC